MEEVVINKLCCVVFLCVDLPVLHVLFIQI